jgi:hypothetical protein
VYRYSVLPEAEWFAVLLVSIVRSSHPRSCAGTLERPRVPYRTTTVLVHGSSSLQAVGRAASAETCQKACSSSLRTVFGPSSDRPGLPPNCETAQVAQDTTSSMFRPSPIQIWWEASYISIAGFTGRLPTSNPIFLPSSRFLPSPLPL